MKTIYIFFEFPEESEKAQARLKGLDESAPPPATNNNKPHKDVNTFINNQLKFTSGAAPLPPDTFKCNILKAQTEETYRKTGLWQCVL